LDFLFLHASEQYFTSPQFLAQDFLQVISFLQTRQILLGKNDLLPLKLVLDLELIKVIQNMLRMQGNFFLILRTDLI